VRFHNGRHRPPESITPIPRAIPRP
jgi:hypothetical protein